MLRVTMRPMVSVRQAAKDIAQWLHNPKAEYIIFRDICDCLTYTDSQNIIRAHLPHDEDCCVADYDIECQKFFQMVKEATELPWGGEFLASLD